jgi:uncharacterized RDD family membrane protein YckC
LARNDNNLPVQSPGKRLLKLCVVRQDITPVSTGQIANRDISRRAELSFGICAVGNITMFLNDQSHRLGDLTTGTTEIRHAFARQMDMQMPICPVLADNLLELIEGAHVH